MKAITHIAASTAAAAIAGAASGTPAAAGIFLFGGFLDVDHVNHFISSGLPSSPRTLLRSIFMNEIQLEKTYSFSRGIPSSWTFPVFHCVEFVFLLAVSGFLLKSSFLMAAGIGVLLHLLMDIRSYPCGIHFFSIIWRFIKKQKLMKEWQTHRSTVMC